MMVHLKVFRFSPKKSFLSDDMVLSIVRMEVDPYLEDEDVGFSSYWIIYLGLIVFSPFSFPSSLML